MEAECREKTWRRARGRAARAARESGSQAAGGDACDCASQAETARDRRWRQGEDRVDVWCGGVQWIVASGARENKSPRDEKQTI